MLPATHAKLAGLLCQGLRLNLARAKCFAAIALSAIQAKSILLASVAAYLPGKARTESKYRRLQHFFQELEIDYADIARLILGLLDRILGRKPFVLAIDGTNWKARKNEVHLLVVSVCLGDVGQPLVWTDLGRRGNSDTRQRVDLMSRLLRVVGVARIQCLLGDREFVGEDWFSWLLEQKIPFAMRMRECMRVTPEGGKTRSATEHFAGLGKGEWMDLGVCQVGNVMTGVCGVRIPSSGELVVLGYSGVSAAEAKGFYLKRWNIETGFEKLKTHGFNMESSRLRGEGKYDRLMAVLAVGLAWCYAMGTWSVETSGRPIRVIKRLGRRAQSTFRRGLELLTGVFLGTIGHIRSTSREAFALFERACLALK